MSITSPKNVLFVGLGLLQDVVIRLLSDQPDIHIIGSVDSWEEAKQSIQENRPDVIIMDHQNPELMEAELHPLLDQHAKHFKIIYLTSADNRIIVHDRMQINDAAMPDLLRALITNSTNEAAQ